MHKKSKLYVWTVWQDKWCGAVLQTGHWTRTATVSVGQADSVNTGDPSLCVHGTLNKQLLHSYIIPWVSTGTSPALHGSVCQSFSGPVMTRHFCALPALQPKDASPKWNHYPFFLAVVFKTLRLFLHHRPQCFTSNIWRDIAPRDAPTWDVNVWEYCAKVWVVIELICLSSLGTELHLGSHSLISLLWQSALIERSR